MTDPSIENDDQRYFDWLATHPEGYVVNTNRKPRLTYMVLHREPCHHIQRWPGRTSTCGQYMKIVADTADELQIWASDRHGTLRICRTCQPQ